MNEELQARLAESLTADSTDLIPYLPYLLQDFWSLASDPEEMAGLLRRHTSFGPGSPMLDLACGKGAVAISLAKEFGCRARGIDLIEAFIEEAREKAREHGVATLCDFAPGDVNEAVLWERGYDLAVWGGSGDLLGGYAKTLAGIAATVRPGGYILLDDGYVEESSQLRFHHEYLTRSGWQELFGQLGLRAIDCLVADEEADPGLYAEDLGNIRRRAEELAVQHPEKRKLFEGYVQSQQSEYEDLQDGVVGALWLLQKE